MKQYTDQIAYRAKHLVDKLAQRDESPSKAARFAAFRYIKLMEKATNWARSYFDDKELDVLVEVAQKLDTDCETNFDLFWAQVDNAGFPNLAQRVKSSGYLTIDAIFDIARVRKYGTNSNNQETNGVSHS